MARTTSRPSGTQINEEVEENRPLLDTDDATPTPSDDLKNDWGDGEAEGEKPVHDLFTLSDSDDDEDDDNEAPDPKPKSSEPPATRHPLPSLDARFNPPAPSPLKRISLIIFTLFLFWLAFTLRGNLLRNKKKPSILYASRYSKEYKYRPAASPVITETLSDGRIRLRGATPPPPEPTSTARSSVGKRKKAKEKTGGKTTKARPSGTKKGKGHGKSSHK